MLGSGNFKPAKGSVAGKGKTPSKKAAAAAGGDDLDEGEDASDDESKESFLNEKDSQRVLKTVHDQQRELASEGHLAAPSTMFAPPTVAAAEERKA
jgi:hypothetical protein